MCSLFELEYQNIGWLFFSGKGGALFPFPSTSRDLSVSWISIHLHGLEMWICCMSACKSSLSWVGCVANGVLIRVLFLIISGNTEMPDAMETIYQSALALGRHGAVSTCFISWTTNGMHFQTICRSKLSGLVDKNKIAYNHSLLSNNYVRTIMNSSCNSLDWSEIIRQNILSLMSGVTSSKREDFLFFC